MNLSSSTAAAVHVGVTLVLYHHACVAFLPVVLWTYSLAQRTRLLALPLAPDDLLRTTTDYSILYLPLFFTCRRQVLALWRFRLMCGLTDTA